jgi:hypothetical protein
MCTTTLYEHLGGSTLSHTDNHLILIDAHGLQTHVLVRPIDLRGLGKKFLALAAEVEVSLHPQVFLEDAAYANCGSLFHDALEPISMTVNGLEVSIRVSLKNADICTSEALDVLDLATFRMKAAGFKVRVCYDV